MRTFGQLLIALGVLLAVGSVALFASVFLYVLWWQPADASGWGAALGGSMIAAISLVPLGLIVLVLGIVLKGNRPRP